MGGRNACIVSVADGRFDSEIERFEGLCPVAKAPWCASLDIIHWWCAYQRLMARIPPGSLCGLRPDRGNLLNPFRKHFQPRIGKIGPIGQEPAERVHARGEVVRFPA